ncbi:MAG: GTPase [Candidatus Verstraetearchaeota archaeon]|nr:GTPase [Candidatus Verstraetearchaeota archaeon]
MTNLIVVGPAGSGKSTLTKALGGWLEREGYAVSYLNLDPGAESLPYRPSYDVRGLVTVERLMREEGLGPNGALIRAAEITEANLPRILKKIEARERRSDFTIIDTPGQMEIFLFRGLGPKLSTSLRGRTISVSLIDPGLLRGKIDLVVLKLLGLVVELRLGIPSIEVLNKSDLYDRKTLLEFEESIRAGGYRAEGVSGELANQLYGVVEGLEKRRRVVMVSAKKGTGMEDLYKAMGEAFCACGDLT